PAVSEPFDPRGHQLPDTQSEPGANAKVGEILATGFTYQGQLLRRALVVLTAEEPEVSTEMALAEPAVPKQEEQLGTATQPDLI
ncbi:MAG TPA: nucleotide exchange factor GrpE, partial [Verrucomicrobiae bacterium]|nr:nucleotide exchange factor GrpE [Verrucomicrobiae bacterium]